MISIVIPIRDEELNIFTLNGEIVKTMVSVNMPCEIIYVDDHSHDNSTHIINELSSKEKNVKCYHLTVESGKDAALMKGMMHATGEIIGTLDGDLQNVPGDIPTMLNLIDECDMVCGIRKKREDALSLVIGSKIANWIRNKITSDTITDAGCAIRVMKAECLEHITGCNKKFFGCAHYFYPTILRKKGYKVIEIPVQHRKRKFGKSKFKLFRGRMVSGLRACFEVNRMISRQKI